MDERLIVLNDQGGAVMSVTYEVTATFRAEMRGHPPIICLEGNGSRPSHMGGGWSEEGKMFTLNTIEKHAVCYPTISIQGDGITNTNKGCWSEGGVQYTLNTVDRHAVCYLKEENERTDLCCVEPSCGQPDHA